MLNNKGMTWISGAELDNGLLVLASHEPDVDRPHTAVVYRDLAGEWHPGGLFGRPTACVAIDPGREYVLMIDPNGVLARFRPGDGTRSRIRPSDSRYNGRSIRFIRNIGGQLIAGGAGHTVHRADPNGVWSEVTTPEMEQTPNPRGFEDAGGFSADELYCAGWNGAIWSCVGGVWAPVQSPTNLLLSAIESSGERMFAAGKSGTIVVGRGDDWQLLDHQITDHDILDIATFNGATWFAGFFGVLKLTQGRLEVAWLAGEEIPSAGTLFVGPSGLWSVGSNALALFDGDRWRVVLDS